MQLAAYNAGQGRQSQRKLASEQQLPTGRSSKIDFFLLWGEGETAHLLDCSVPVTSAIVNTSRPAAHIPYSKGERLQSFLLTVTPVSACNAFILLRAQ